MAKAADNLPSMDELHWWSKVNSDKKLLEKITSAFDLCYGSNQPRGRTYGNFWRLYGSPSNEVNALGGGKTDTLSTTGYQATERRLSVPLCASVIDTLSSKLASDRPRPFFCTSGGTAKSMESAKHLQAFGDSSIYETDLYTKAMLAFKDCGIYGDGFLLPYKDQNKRLACEVVPPAEVLVAHDDARYSDPRTIYRWKNEDKDILIAMYPKAKKEIIKAYNEEAAAHSTTSRKYLSNRIRIVMAWHLPSYSMELTDAQEGDKIDDKEVKGPETDGRAVVFIPNRCIVSDKPFYSHECPLVKLSYNPSSDCYWSNGICASLGNLQADVNTGLRRIQRSMHLHSNPHWITYRGAQMQFGALNSGMGTEIRVAAPGMEPKLESFEAMGADTVQHIETQIERFFQFSGVSNLSATSQKPAGLNSGEAIRSYNDIGAERFQALGKRFEAFIIEVMKRFITVAGDIAKEEKSYPVKYVNRKAIRMSGTKVETFDFKDVDIDSLDYVIQISPVDSLSNDVAGRIQMVSEMAQSGAPIDPLQLYSLLELPDTPAYFKRLFASRELVEKMVYKILYDGKFVPPNAFLDLMYAQQYATQEIAEAMCADDISDERIEMLQEWLDAVVALQTQAKQAAAAQLAASQPPQQGTITPQGITKQPVAPQTPAVNPLNSGSPQGNS